MSTPFQKAFPNADENTVFEVVDDGAHKGLGAGALMRLHFDDGTSAPKFKRVGGRQSFHFPFNRLARKNKKHQTVTLQDGTELTIPNDAVDKLREEYA